MNINTDQVIDIRRWDPETSTVVWETANVSDLIKSPEMYNLADLGFFFLNELRKQSELEPYPKGAMS